MITGTVKINNQTVTTMDEVTAIVTPDVFRVNDPDDTVAYDRAFFLTSVANGIHGNFTTFTEGAWAIETEDA